MSLGSGEKVYYKTFPEVVQRQATVVSAEGETIVLDLAPGHGVEAGQKLVISSGSRQYFAEVVEAGREAVTLRQNFANSREYFRVEDVVPIIVRKVGAGEAVRPSRAFPFHDSGLLDTGEGPGEDVNPRLWKMLVNIHSMLGMVLERLDLESEGFLHAEKKQVNMSATGMAFRAKERYAPGDILEVKMLLPAHPPFGVLVCGTVVRAEDAGDGETEIALRFNGIDEELRDEIIQYTLVRQREIIRKSRG